MDQKIITAKGGIKGGDERNREKSTLTAIVVALERETDESKGGVHISEY